jgi:hypothetical protein
MDMDNSRIGEFGYKYLKVHISLYTVVAFTRFCKIFILGPGCKKNKKLVWMLAFLCFCHLGYIYAFKIRKIIDVLVPAHEHGQF